MITPLHIQLCQTLFFGSINSKARLVNQNHLDEEAIQKMMEELKAAIDNPPPLRATYFGRPFQGTDSQYKKALRMLRDPSQIPYAEIAKSCQLSIAQVYHIRVREKLPKRRQGKHRTAHTYSHQRCYVKRLVKLWKTNLTQEAIMLEMNISYGHLKDLIKYLNLPPRPWPKKRRRNYA